MKLNNIFSAIAGVALAASLTGCDGEKDLIIIDGDLPIKTSTLYMVGDATPNGWSIDNPTPLVASADDNLVYTWEGELFKGEIKLCLTPGSWDAGFIRPTSGNEEINKNGQTDVKFQMHAGDPDEKWRVTEAGNYLLTFNLRNWTMSAKYLGEADIPVLEPLEVEQLYMVGDATPCGWNIDEPFPLTKLSTYVWQYEGEMENGEFKCVAETGNWDAEFIRPYGSACKVGPEGAEFSEMTYSNAPDNKWEISEAGKYRLTFDLEHYTFTSEYLGAIEISGEEDPNALNVPNVFIIGDATPNGWDMGNATKLTRSATDRYIFTFEGFLDYGDMKACGERDGSFSCPFLRPSTDGVEISSRGVNPNDFIFTTEPDNKWRVVEPGNYRITFDLRNWTIKAEMLGSAIEPEYIQTETLYLIGDATLGGWDMDNLTALTPNDDFTIFSAEVNLTTGSMKACIAPDGSFSCPFLRPSVDGCKIDANGVQSYEFIYTKDPDYKWEVTKAGKYRLTFNLKEWSIEAQYLGETNIRKR